MYEMGLSSEFSHLDSPMDAAHNMSVRSVARSEQNLVLLCLLSRSYRIGFLKIGCKDTKHVKSAEIPNCCDVKCLSDGISYQKLLQ